MKKHLIGLFMLAGILFSSLVQAQEARQFLIGGDHPVGISGFGGPIIEISSLENEVVVSGGGGGALLLDQTFFVGLYGLGTIKSLEQSVPEFPEVDMAFGHGGLWLGYIHQSERLLHAGFSLKIGGGGAVLASREGSEFIFEEENKIDDDGFFVLTPQAEVELNSDCRSSSSLDEDQCQCRIQVCIRGANSVFGRKGFCQSGRQYRFLFRLVSAQRHL